MIIEQLKDENNLTDSEKLIASYLLDESNNINNMTSTHLVKATFTSQSTVVRLYQKIGFRSYREFMAVLAVERKDYFRTDNLINSNASMSSYEETQAMITKVYENTITNTNHKVDRNTMIRICNRIFNASIVDIYAIGFCSSIGAYLQNAMETINIHCTFQNDISPFYLKNIDNNKNHMALILCIDSNDETVLKIAETLNELQIYCVSIAQSKDSLLSKYCQDTLYTYKNNTTIDESLAITSNLYIILILTSLISAKTYNILDKY